jgi:hypothetical protein
MDRKRNQSASPPSSAPSSPSTPAIVLSPKEEHDIIRAIWDAHRMRVQQNYYVINAKWWSLWKDYVKFDEKEPTTFGQRPDRIDNEPLLEDLQPADQNENNKESKEEEGTQTKKPSKKKSEEEVLPQKPLRKGLAPSFDYEVLPGNSICFAEQFHSDNQVKNLFGKI